MSDYKSRLEPIPMSRCRHITCKGMGIYGSDYRTPENEMHRTNDFWCLHTQNVLGPDGALVTLSQCTVERRCFEEL